MTPSLDALLTGYRALIEAELREVVGAREGELWSWMRYHLGWEDADGRPSEAASGKLLRAAGVLLAAEALGGDPARAVPAAAAIELVHNFSLLHDDIEDRSERRRDRATLWTLIGVPQAINAGDGMHALARLALLRLAARGFEDATVLAAALELDQACLRLVEGQQADMAMEGRSEVTRDTYLAMIEGKTAAMFATPLALGALLGGGSSAQVQAFREFGHHTGMAFQAADDLLGIWGDPRVTGKAASDDLRARKMTLPVIAAIEAGGDEATAFALDYARPPAPGEDYAGLAARIEHLGGRAATEAYAAAEEAAARDALARTTLGEEWREALLAFSSAATYRAS
ncbi:MAG: polyprenyl synthetase family protein [Dehalococcoidia bacterium]|nr:polyprenyl synthetase family protein [Dehalococcoidia bacterium]